MVVGQGTGFIKNLIVAIPYVRSTRYDAAIGSSTEGTGDMATSKSVKSKRFPLLRHLQPLPELQEQLRTYTLRVKMRVSAKLLWDKVLSDRERRLLGGDFSSSFEKIGTVGMWKELRGVSEEKAILDIALNLNLMDPPTFRWLSRELGEHEDPEERLEFAIAHSLLVLVERPREAYWKNERIEIDWVGRPAMWDFFWELCRHAKKRQAIDQLTFGSSRNNQYVAKQKSRLLSLTGFPADLGDLIRPVGRGAQTLQIEPQTISLFPAMLNQICG